MNMKSCTFLRYNQSYLMDKTVEDAQDNNSFWTQRVFYSHRATTSARLQTSYCLIYHQSRYLLSFLRFYIHFLSKHSYNINRIDESLKAFLNTGGSNA
jgi:hypothetical protein